MCKKQIIAKAVGENVEKFTSISGHLAIDDFIIINSILEEATIPYPIRKIGQDFGANSKILPDINSSLFQNKLFIHQLDELYDDLEKFSAIKEKR